MPMTNATKSVDIIREPAATPGACRYCGRPNENNPGDYYHSKYCESSWTREQIAEETDPRRRDALCAKLELAEYVGD